MALISIDIYRRIHAALSEVAPEALKAASPEVLRVVPCTNPEHGDYQWNGALSLARFAAEEGQKPNPRALAQRLLDALDVADICEPPQIAGPGFLNFRLLRAYLERSARELLSDERAGVPGHGFGHGRV